MARLWRAWERIGWPFGPLFKLLLMTGQRRSAVAGLRLSDIALASQIWTLPSGRGRAHQVPLSALAVEILASQPRLDSPYVFPARGRPNRPVSGFSKAAARAAGLAGVADLRLQDLRRTAAAGMARLGTPPHLIAGILDLKASLPGLPGAPRGDGSLEEKRRALEAWSAHLQQVLEHDGDVTATLDD